MTSLIELAAKVETLTEPSFEIDCEIGVAVGLFIRERRDRDKHEWYYEVGSEYSRRHISRHVPEYQRMPHYTESLDAALALVPEGFLWSCGYSRNVPHQASLVDYKAHTGRYDGNSDFNRACALTAAALRASAAIEDRS